MKLRRTSSLFLMTAIILLLSKMTFAQYKDYKISAKGDTLNATLLNGTKTGKWVLTVPELRGEPGYVEEGEYKDGYKHGVWRKYTIPGDLLSVENYFNGGKSGVQQYFTYLGDLQREESWKAYDPDSPYDTVAIYGTGSNEILEYKLFKAEPYSVKNGEWKYYDVNTGAVIKTETWELNNLKLPNSAKTQDIVAGQKKEVPKTAQMLEWEKKNKGKKGVVRDGSTGL